MSAGAHICIAQNTHTRIQLVEVSGKVLLVLLKFIAVSTGNSVTLLKESVIIIIFTPSISGIGGTSLVFHFYPCSALFHLPAAIFTSSHFNSAELRPDASWWDVITQLGIVYLFLPGSSELVLFTSAVEKLASVQLTAPAKQSDKYMFQQGEVQSRDLQRLSRQKFGYVVLWHWTLTSLVDKVIWGSRFPELYLSWRNLKFSVIYTDGRK